MNSLLTSLRLRRGIAWLVMVSMTLTQSAQVAALTLATSPLAATTTSVVRPNLMYVLDDSGSMSWDYTPDYINDATITDPLNAGTGPAGSSGDTGSVTMSGPFPGSRSVTAITAVGGNLYYETPAVVIEGGGGTGAAATAVWNSATKKITSVTVNNGGSGYTSTPFVTFVGKLTAAAWGMCWGTTGASNQGGTPKDTNASPQCTTPTQIPYAAAPVNYQYYDPAVYYEVPRKAAWTSNCAVGSATCYYPNATPTAASSDGFLNGATKNLTNAWTHEVWCNVSTAVPSAADPTAAGKCRENLDSSGDTMYPNATFTFRKTYSGPAFYYTMAPSEFCTSDSLTNCVRSTSPTVVGPTTFNVPSKYRWCAYYNPQSHTFGGCQARRDWSHYIPNYLGGWISTGAAGVQATATLTINSVAAGQSMTDLTIGGVSVLGGTTIAATGASTTTSVATAVCDAIKAQTGTTGYGCAATGSDVLIQAAIVGTAANGAQVLASGPPDVAAANSTGSIFVTGATTGFSITGISINHAPTAAQLISDPVVATGNCGGITGIDCGSTAQLICQAINSGPSQGVYIARSGDDGAPPGWGTCQSNPRAWIGIMRIPADAVDNGLPIVITAPAAATISTGTITVNATGGATRLSDVTLNGTSILSTKPLDYADGTQTASIATDIASKIVAAGCTASATANVVSITGTCVGTIAVSAVGTAATGTFRVSSTGSTNPASLGGIQVNTANLVGAVTSTQLTNGTAVSANATALQSAIGTYQTATYTAPNRFSVAAPVAAAGGSYDVTVTAPVGNSYNGLSFTFLAGTASAGGAGSQPQWVFPITGATADNAPLTSITCGGTTAVGARSTGSTSANANWVQNLIDGFNGKVVAGPNGNYSYSCGPGSLASPAQRCTITGPTNVAACTPFTVTPTAGISVTNNGLITAGAANPQWTFNISGATTDNGNLNSLSCGGSSIFTGIANTGSSSSANHILNLATALNGQTRNSYSWSCPTPSNGQCTLTGPSGSAACTNLSITKDASISVTAAQTSAGSTTNLVVDRINNLAAKLNTDTPSTSAGSAYSFSCGTATAGTPSSLCTITGPVPTSTPPANCSIDKSSTITLSTTTPSLVAGTGTVDSTFASNLATSIISRLNGSYWDTGSSTCTANSGAGTVACTLVRAGSTVCYGTPSVNVGAGLSVSSGPTLNSSATQLSFTVSGASAASRTVNSVNCDEATSSTNTVTTTGAASTGTSSNTTTLAGAIIPKLSSTYWDTGNSSCTAVTSGFGAPYVYCYLRPTAQNGCLSNFTGNLTTLNWFSSFGWGSFDGTDWKLLVTNTGGNNRTINSLSCDVPTGKVTTNGLTSSATTGTTVTTGNAAQYQFSITGATTNNRSIHSIFCGSNSTGCLFEDGSGSCNNQTLYNSSMAPSTGNPTGSSTSPTWSFNITAAPTDSKTISSVQCNGVETLTSAANSGASTTLTDAQRVNALGTWLTGHPATNWTIAQNTSATGSGSPPTTPATFTATGPLSANACAWTSSKDASITLSTPSQVAGTGTGTPSWSFDITNATANSLDFGALSCGGTSLLPAPTPNTGTTPASVGYQRINNLSGSNGVSSGTVGPTNGYTLVCQPATASSAQPSCTLTGPVGLGACNGSTLVFNKDSTISVGAVTFTNGSASSSATDNFYVSDGNALSTAAPFGTGRAPQGATAFGVAGVDVGPISANPGTMSNGNASSPLAIPTNATGSPALNMTGGQAVDTATNHWADLGIFKRTDIVSTNNAYSRASGRTDCQAATCTYNEEIQNFANWYAYYRTRMQMMKSATTVAFSQLDGNYRVGYDNICSPTGTTVRERVGQFVDTGGETANQRTSWWTNLTGSNPSCATPLRAETAKIGKYYAGKLAASGDPLQYSCQQNFMMLVTDGYWNENEPSATSILGADVGNVDNVLATSPYPYYDGAQAATACPGTGTGRGTNASSCRTLADITRYYYATDLRSSAKEVLVTTSASHGLSPGQKVTISGVVSTPPAVDPNATFNGDVVAYVTGPTTFRYVPTNDLTVNPTNDPGTYGSGGTITVNGTSIGFSSVSVTTGLYGNATNTAGVDVATNNVMTGADDLNGHQHMNFYAMGLGIDGTLEYRSDYQTATTGDYAEIVAGTRNWPAVANLDPTGVDDLWHATANGHGKYFSARNLPNVVAGLREALTKIGSRVGSASAAATSNLQPVSGDNFAYVGSYGTQDWVGDLQSRSIDLVTGNVSSSAACSPGATPGCQWSLQAKIDNMTWSARRIYVKPGSGATGDPLRVFNWANLTGGEQAYFNPSSLSQYTVLAVSNASDITGENLTEFLRGYRGLEQDGNVSHAQIWRNRAHVLGDIVNTQPIYMKAPSRNYSDGGYAAFKASGTAATRKPVVFVSSQDGFLHAINANTPNASVSGDTGAVTIGAATVQPGEELWAFIPTQAMQNMKVLADINYSSHHRYFVDGPITVADVNFGGSDSDWHTILVGGHGAGGTAYFALDVTDPINPKYLWEFTDTNLGYSFSNPTVTKLPTGDWAVLFTSGYNNNTGGGDGVGRLYALNPKTGAIKTGFPMDTGTGTVGTPSNLGKISVWVDNASNNNTAKFVYAGDTNGDLWRFDFDPTAAGHSSAAVFKLAHLTAPDGSARPITTKVELTTAMTSTNDVVHVVMGGTGQYLEAADLTNTDVQSFYAIKDTLGADNMAVGAGQQTVTPRTAAVAGVPKFLKRKLIGTRTDGSKIKYTDEYGQLVDGRVVCPVGINGAQPTVVSGTTCVPGNDAGGTPEATPTMDWGAYDGWMVDLPDSGERLNVDPKLNAGTIVFATNVPSATACTSAGSAFTNFLDYSTGLAVYGQTIASRKVSNALVVGLTVITLPSGEAKVIVTRSDAKPDTYKVPVLSSSSSVFQNKRSLWREFEAY